MTKKKTGLTSEEAAALYLSDGRTRDIVTASAIDQGQELSMDALKRAHLRRMMGFDFRLKLAPNKIHVSSTQKPYVSTWFKIGEYDVLPTVGGVGFGITNEATINKLVDACLRLKLKYEKASK